MGESGRAELPPVTYLDEEAATAAFFGEVAGARELAVDTEGASFHRFVDRVYLIQLSTRERHAIIDPLAVHGPDLGAMLADPDVEVVFHDADYDLRLLRQDYGWSVSRLFDTRVAAQLLGIRQFGLAALLEANFGVKLDKRHQRADWSMRPLTPDMLEYAAQDTIHLLGLRDILRNSLMEKGRLHWAEEEFSRLREVEWAENDPTIGFLRMKGARDLPRRALGVLREVFAWRDTVASGIDRATFRVLSNDVLLEVARRAPTTPDLLVGIKGVPRGWAPARIDDVLAAVKRGLAIPDLYLPRFQRALRWERHPHFDERVSALRTARDITAAKLDIDPGVLCSRERLEAVARRLPRSVEELHEVKELRHWQVEVLGEALVAAVAAVD